MKKFLFLFSALVLISCREEAPQNTGSNSAGKAAFSEELQVTTNRRVELLPEARAEVNEWLAYATAQNEMQNLRNSTGHDILESSNSIMQIMESLKESTPDTLQTPAVQSRTNVLVTKAKILHQLSNKKQKNAEEIFEVANDLIVEFDNFKLQLNELFLKTPVDFEQELDEEFEEAKQGQPRNDTTSTLPVLSRE
ncbi:hypothetical protein V6B16_04760 [Salinimicrobium catena]|uniref:hypothetical protein n=1 Tax=Salinimicrobium catena TaxID=390640 RepID=UPI002FE4F003